MFPTQDMSSQACVFYLQMRYPLLSSRVNRDVAACDLKIVINYSNLLNLILNMLPTDLLSPRPWDLFKNKQ